MSNQPHLDWEEISLHKPWINQALEYIEPQVGLDFLERIEIVCCTDSRQACRIPRSICRKKEVIVISGLLCPHDGLEETHPEVRLFIFTVLHEIAHARFDHRSPVLDGLSTDEYWRQENEADDQARTWFNTAAENYRMSPITKMEIEKSRETARLRMNKYFQ